MVYWEIRFFLSQDLGMDRQSVLSCGSLLRLCADVAQVPGMATSVTGLKFCGQFGIWLVGGWLKSEWPNCYGCCFVKMRLCSDFFGLLLVADWSFYRTSMEFCLGLILAGDVLLPGP
ncbi:hypothetical protein Nepgr_026007 [Nepenthes gracilis]|uniref:Uncharacterized protein n=1 Tax=Nepenthes gracilis TaxID=150966 RepID=A0AAD3Y1M6_NEPGR|nr:hypothetical protein Nepgr_026007 [Nepenthes gracilis]